MKPTILNLHSGFPIGRVDPRLFGGFLEHMGRAVYGGIVDPEHPTADADGCRTDVLDRLRRLRMTAMRYPGGNFASGYHWMDGIGPRERRPTVRELAWQSLEPNQFGTDEFISLCRRMTWTPMLTVNLGTGTPEEARNWVEYCNSPVGTRYADQRRDYGHPAPHPVKLWCLGNEMDGPWQLGHVPAADYARHARQAAQLMKAVDPSIELVAGGSCGTYLPTYMDWDRQVLEILDDLADYISLHRYVGNETKDTPDYLAVTKSIDEQIEAMDAACRFEQARRKTKKRAFLCFDEWNVWYKNRTMDGKGRLAPPLLEETYNLEDALVVAGFLCSFIRHADVVKIANLAQIVNVIAPIMTRPDGVLIQSIFHPFEMISKRRDGIALRIGIDGPTYTGRENGTVTTVDAAAILDQTVLSVFLTNRHPDQPADVTIRPANITLTTCENAEILTGPSPTAANSFEAPDVIRPIPFDAIKVERGQATVQLPPLSFTAMSFRL